MEDGTLEVHEGFPRRTRQPRHHTVTTTRVGDVFPATIIPGEWLRHHQSVSTCLHSVHKAEFSLTLSFCLASRPWRGQWWWADSCLHHHQPSHSNFQQFSRLF